jgi:hypothetical protein
MKYDWSSITPPSSESVTIDPFAVSFDVPARWRAGKQQGDLIVLGSHSDAGMIVTHAGLYDAFEPFFGAVSRFFSGLGLAARATDGPREKHVGSYRGIVASYEGSDSEGNQIASHLYGLLSRDGVGAGVVGITAPGGSGQIAERVDSIARSIFFGSFKPDPVIAESLVGEWKRSTTPARYSFASDGTYTLSAGSTLQDAGRFSVASGKLILASTRAGSSTYSLRLHGKLLEIGEGEYVRV